MVPVVVVVTGSLVQVQYLSDTVASAPSPFFTVAVDQLVYCGIREVWPRLPTFQARFLHVEPEKVSWKIVTTGAKPLYCRFHIFTVASRTITV